MQFAHAYQAIAVVHQLVRQNVFHIRNVHRTKRALIYNVLIHALAVFVE